MANAGVVAEDLLEIACDLSRQSAPTLVALFEAQFEVGVRQVRHCLKIEGLGAKRLRAAKAKAFRRSGDQTPDDAHATGLGAAHLQQYGMGLLIGSFQGSSRSASM